jgi:hypothetical protein
MVVMVVVVVMITMMVMVFVVMMMMIVSELHVRLGTGLIVATQAGCVYETQKRSSIRDWIEQFAK